MLLFSLFPKISVVFFFIDQERACRRRRHCHLRCHPLASLNAHSITSSSHLGSQGGKSLPRSRARVSTFLSLPPSSFFLARTEQGQGALPKNMLVTPQERSLAKGHHHRRCHRPRWIHSFIHSFFLSFLSSHLSPSLPKERKERTKMKKERKEKQETTRTIGL